MRIVFSGDWQCSVTNLVQCEQIVNQICTLLRAGTGPRYFIHTGDAKEANNPVDQRVTNFLLEAFQTIRKDCDHIGFVRGNHDYITTQDGVPSCTPVVAAGGADTVADTDPEQINTPHAMIYLVPYFRDPTRQREAFRVAASKLSSNRYNILVFHNEVKGCAWNNFKKSEEGLTPEDIRAKQYALCISGHIHKPQELKPNIHYVGSPFAMDWGEANFEHRILIADFHKSIGSLSSAPSVVPGWYDPDVPGFTAPVTWKGTRVRLNVPVGKNPEKELEAAREKAAKKYPGANLHLVPQYTDIDLSPAHKFTKQGTDEEVLRSYLSTIDLPAGVVPDQVVEYIRQFLPHTSLFGVQGLRFGEMAAKDTLCFKDIKFDWDRKGLTLLTGSNQDWDTEISNGCIAKGTFIDCPRDLIKYPFGIPIEKLVGTRPWVYGYDLSLGRIVLRQASWVKKTGTKVPVVRICFKEPWGTALGQRTNYRPQTHPLQKRIPYLTELVLTADHLVMLRNGRYRKAGALKPNDRIMPLYRRCKDGEYWGIGLSDGNGQSGPHSTRSSVEIESRFILSEIEGNRGPEYDAHHKNENKSDNDPSNLEWKSKAQHQSDHLRERNLAGTTGWQKTGVHPRGMLGKHHTKKTKARISKTTKKTKALIPNNHIVDSVTPFGTSDVYDIHVPKIHNFVANSVVVHNSGKSSFTTLPFLALFGRTFKNQVFDGWARQGVNNAASVRQHLRLPNDSELVVQRGRRPNVFTVKLDGQDITMGDANRTQAAVEQITNLTWSVLTNAVYIGQQEIGSVFGTEKERKELFSRLLGLERFLDAVEKLRKVYSRLEKAAAEIDTETAAANSAVIEATSSADLITYELANAPVIDAKDLKAKQRRIPEIESLIRRNDRIKADLNPELDKNQAAFEKLLFKGADFEATARRVREQLEASEKVGGECRVCGSKVEASKLEKFQKRLEAEIRAAELECDHYEALQASNRNTRKALTEKYSKCDLENRELQKELAALHRIVDDLTAKTEARQKLEDMLANATSRIKELQRKVKIHEAAHAATLLEQEFIEVCMKVVGRDGLPAYLIASIAPLLNQAAADYSEIFSEGEIGVAFETLQGDIEVSVVNRHGGDTIRDQSRGEMRLAAIIAALAFRDVLVKHNILILDEPTDGLDPVNAAVFARGLNKIVDRFQHVMIISHNTALLSELEPDLHLQVVKQGGVSRLRAV